MEVQSLYAIHKALSWSLLILLLIFLLWNIHTKGKYWNWLVTYAFIKCLNSLVPRYADIRDKANSLLPAFLHILLTCFSKLRFALIKTPNSFSSCEFLTVQLPIFMLTSWSVFTPNTIKWHLSSLNFIKLFANHSIIIWESFSNLEITFSRCI